MTKKRKKRRREEKKNGPKGENVNGIAVLGLRKKDKCPYAYLPCGKISIDHSRPAWPDGKALDW